MLGYVALKSRGDMTGQSHIPGNGGGRLLWDASAASGSEVLGCGMFLTPPPGYQFPLLSTFWPIKTAQLKNNVYLSGKQSEYIRDSAASSAHMTQRLQRDLGDRGIHSVKSGHLQKKPGIY